jgi:pimeloyl-ACP methyl ester carboxylesterase
MIALTLLVSGCYVGDGEVARTGDTGGAGRRPTESKPPSGGSNGVSNRETGEQAGAFEGGAAGGIATDTSPGSRGNSGSAGINVGANSGLDGILPISTSVGRAPSTLTLELGGMPWGGPSNSTIPGAGGMGGLPTDPEDTLPIPEVGCGLLDVAGADYATKDVATGEIASATASPTKLFYSFVPAQKGPRSAPLFVFFNGGPASATMGMLRSFGTGPMSLDESTSTTEPAPNPNNWATLGNLLYIDARQSGFSFSTLENAQDTEARMDEFTARNFNPYIDAADFVRALLRFFELEPALRNNPVVIVGESYGGLRASLMLTYLLDSPRIAKAGWYFHDAELAAEIQAHYAQVFPAENPETVTGAAAARQFGYQVLIQPALAYYLQQHVDKCNPQYGFRARVAALGLTCPPQKVDGYNVAKAEGWTDGLLARSALMLHTPSTYAALMGVPADELTELTAVGRPGAFRVVDTFEETTTWLGPRTTAWTSAYGELPEYDRYYVAANDDARSACAYSYPSAISALSFLQNVQWVKTLVTRAMLDGVIVADAVPATLLQFSRVALKSQFVTDITVDLAPRPGVTRSGWFKIQYAPAAGSTESVTREIRFPTYENAGHVVSISQPRELLEDVASLVTSH